MPERRGGAARRSGFFFLGHPDLDSARVERRWLDEELLGLLVALRPAVRMLLA